MGQGPGSFLGDVHSNLMHISGFYRRWGPHQVQDGNFGLSKSTWISEGRWMWFLEHQPVQFSSVQSLSRVWLFETLWIAPCQASLSITNSWSSPKLMSIKSVMPSSHLFLCYLLLLLPLIPPASESFPMSQLFAWGGQRTGVSALASFLPKNTQDWCPLEWTCWISLQSKRISRVFSSTTVQRHQFFGA